MFEATTRPTRTDNPNEVARGSVAARAEPGPGHGCARVAPVLMVP